MALRLVRQTSETPNITNKDDTIMTRYAYGGYNGIVKGFGSECVYTFENGVFKVLDGRIVVDGWEIDIDGAGWSLNLSTVTDTQYHSVYAEINVATEMVRLNSTYLTGSYPEIEKGDDLTSILNGTARLLLYNVKVENGAITEVVKKFEIIRHIKERLDELGFKEGVADLIPYNEGEVVVPSPSVNSLKKQGKYCIFNFNFNYEEFIKFKIVIPEGFRPKQDSSVICFGPILTLPSYDGVTFPTIKTNGEIVFDVTALTSYSFYNVAWEIA